MTEYLGTRRNYLDQMRRALELHRERIPQSEIEGILRDTAEHFEMGKEAGKTEEEIAKSLGDPDRLAEAYVAQNLIQPPPKADQAGALSRNSLVLFRAMKAVFILAPLNFFMMLGPFLVLLVLVIAGWIVSGSIGLATLAALAQFLTAGSGAGLAAGAAISLALIFFGLGCIGLSVIGLLIMVKLSEWAFRLMWAWARWNINFLMAA